MNPGNTMPGENVPIGVKPVDCLSDLPLAMAYVPMQGWEETYEPAEALMNGTVFPCLNLPFLGGAKR
ncbi:MAG: spore coat associated protein CotJA [Firmicutes bacterium]|nr:spore coat associated protein CotJA [Bacillota bacterium]